MIVAAISSRVVTCWNDRGRSRNVYEWSGYVREPQRRTSWPPRAGQERGDGPLDLLEDDRRQVFLERYEAEIAIAYPAQPDGKILLGSPTVFIL